MILKNCRIIQDSKEELQDLRIEKGKIAEISSHMDSDEGLDLSDRYVLPGMIDPHVHFREPGMTHKEDFYTGSRACAAGGITTFIDMPNTIPPTTTLELLDKKRKLAKKSIVNYGFHFAGAADNIDEIRNVRNVASIKVFMNLSTGKLLISDDNVLKKIFSSSRLVTVHAEGPMVEKAIKLSLECGNSLYLCHISQREELDEIREHKTAKIYAEVTPHHLFLSDENDNDSFTKMKPSLKSVLDQEALYEAIKEGLIDTIGTDHAPHTIAEKLDAAPPYGVPGVETMLPLLLNTVNMELLDMQTIVRLCCENPAKIFGIKNKGFIKEGYDADLIVLDMDMVQEVNEDMLFSKSKWTPFAGRTLKGWPVMTIVNGNVVFDHGDIIDTFKGKEVEFDA